MIGILPGDFSVFAVLLGLCLLSSRFWPAVRFAAILAAITLLWLFLWTIFGQLFALLDFSFLQDFKGWKAISLVNILACMVSAVPSILLMKPALKNSRNQSFLFRISVSISLGTGIIAARLYPDGIWPPHVYPVAICVALVSIIFAYFSKGQQHKEPVQ